jgi:putative transposase
VPYDPYKHHRQSARLKGYDYTQAGAYFVTICAYKRQPLFGKIVDGKMRLSLLGQLVYAEWQKTAVIRPNIYLDAFVVMPNHLHGIIVIFFNEAPLVGATRRVAPTLQSGSLGAIIGQFKSVVTKRYRRFRKNDDSPIWQRNYYEQIIRNERHLTAVQQYIHNNPANWTDDDYFLADGE